MKNFDYSEIVIIVVGIYCLYRGFMILVSGKLTDREEARIRDLSANGVKRYKMLNAVTNLIGGLLTIVISVVRMLNLVDRNTFRIVVLAILVVLILAYFLPETSLGYQLLLYFGVVAFSEEGFKYLLLKKQTWRSPHFNCQFDGVIYAVFVSLGFAIWENIGYVLRYGLATAMARALTAIPGHACFGVFMGVWYGVARRQEMWGYPEDARHSRVMAVVLPALLHGLYDFIATQQRESLSLVFVAFVAVLFVAAYRLAKRTANNDRFIDPNVGPYGDGNREE